MPTKWTPNPNDSQPKWTAKMFPVKHLRNNFAVKSLVIITNLTPRHLRARILGMEHIRFFCSFVPLLRIGVALVTGAVVVGGIVAALITFVERIRGEAVSFRTYAVI